MFAFARLFGEDMLFPKAKPDCSFRPDLELLYGTATGDRGGFLVFPMNAVRWLTEPRDIAALVTDSGRDRFSAELFHFGDRPRTMAAELYLLSPGRYTLTLPDSDGHPLAAPKPFQVDGRGPGSISSCRPENGASSKRATASSSPRGRVGYSRPTFGRGLLDSRSADGQ